MTRLWEKMAGRAPASGGRSVDLFGLDPDWVRLFSADFPSIQTSMGVLNEENVPSTHSDGYRLSSPVFSLISARMQVFSQARFQWTRFKGGKPTDLYDSPDLAILNKPWAGGTTADLLARMELDVSIAGNSYICRGVDQLHRLYPQFMYIILGSNTDEEHPSQAWDSEVIGYAYRPPNAKMKIFLPDELAHYAPIPDPEFNFLGMSWLSPVIRDMRADSLMTEHKSSYMRNAATPNLAVKFDPSVSLPQVKEFKELMEEEHTGVFNAWKTLYMGGGADATVIGSNFKELDFAATQGKGESRMASAAGVPPSWVGFSEGLQGSALNAGNFSSARRRFSDGTMQHLWTNACSSLEPIMTKPKKSATLWFTTAAAAFMREDAGELATIQSSEASTLMTLTNSGFTPQSAIAAVINNDWSLLVHTGLTSVQLVPPSDGKEPNAAEDTGATPGPVPAEPAAHPTEEPDAPEAGTPS